MRLNGTLVNDLGRLGTALRRMGRDQPLAAVGLIIVVLMIVLASFSQVGPFSLAPYDPYRYDADAVLQAPSMAHIFGTDALGRDVLSRLIHGARVTLLVSVLVTVLSLALGLLVGGSSGFIGGRFDLLVQRFVDGWLAFPFIVLALVLVGVFQDIGQTFFWGVIKVIVALTLSFGFWMSRIIRGAVLSVLVNEYVESARVTGCSSMRIFRLYVCKNILAPILVLGTVILPWVIFTESALSFLGFGIPPSEPSWGRMLFEGSQVTGTNNAWWLALFPGLFIGVAIFGANMLGDGLRDMLDPRMRRAIGGSL